MRLASQKGQQTEASRVLFYSPKSFQKNKQKSAQDGQKYPLPRTEILRHLSTITFHHRLNGHELEQTLGDSGGQRSLGATVRGVAESGLT